MPARVMSILRGSRAQMRRNAEPQRVLQRVWGMRAAARAFPLLRALGRVLNCDLSLIRGRHSVTAPRLNLHYRCLVAFRDVIHRRREGHRSEEHTSELQSPY